MRALASEGRLRASLDWDGALDQDHEAVRHELDGSGLALCGADAGEDMTPGGTDCPECADLRAELGDTCGHCPLGADPYTCAETCPAAGGPA